MITSWEVDQAFEVSAVAAIDIIDSKEDIVGKVKPTSNTEIIREDKNDFMSDMRNLRGIHWIDEEYRFKI